jgi:hypothetical protein
VVVLKNDLQPGVYVVRILKGREVIAVGKVVVVQ